MRRYFILVFDIIKQWRTGTQVRLPNIRDTVGTFIIYMSVFALLLAVSSTLLTYRVWQYQQEKPQGIPNAQFVKEQQKAAEGNTERPAAVTVGKPVSVIQEKVSAEKRSEMSMEGKPDKSDMLSLAGEIREERIDKPLTGKILTAYGWREDPVYKDWRFHAGVNIQAEKGSEVLAVKSGKVKDISKKDSGIFIKMDHSDGMVTIYGHIADHYVHIGQFLGQGQVLGRLGTDGETSLHFEIWKDNRSIDPSGIIGE